MTEPGPSRVSALQRQLRSSEPHDERQIDVENDVDAIVECAADVSGAFAGAGAD